MDYRSILLRSALLSHSLITALDDLNTEGRLDARAAAFNRQYFELQKTVAPYAYVPWPSVYSYTEDTVLVFTVVKVLACLAFIFDFAGARCRLKNLLLCELFVHVLGATQCTCFFIGGLCVVAGVMMSSESRSKPAKSDSKEGGVEGSSAKWSCCKSSKSQSPAEAKKKKHYYNSTSKKSQQKKNRR